MSTKKQIIHAANKFMKWLHEQRPMIPLLKFEPFDLARIKQIQYDEKHRETHLILAGDYKKILKKVDERILPIIHLCNAFFGLRRSEAMGLDAGHVRQGHLMIDRQLLTIKKHGPPKGRKARKVPYWDSTALEALSVG